MENSDAKLAADKVAAAPFFDTMYYFANYVEESKGNLLPLDHYLTVGWQCGLNPSADFNTNYYLNTNADVAESGVNPLVHYALVGRKEGRRPSADASSDAFVLAPGAEHWADQAADSVRPAHHYLDPAKLDVASHLGAIRELFDQDFYLDSEPDVAASGIDPFHHYLHQGWREGRDPSPHFSTRGYLAQYGGDLPPEMNPLAHYVILGRDKGYAPEQSDSNIKALDRHDAEMARVRAHFDEQYYVSTNDDVRDAQIDPFLHYYYTGWRESRDPAPWFSTDSYLEAYGDVLEPDVNPFAYFLLKGDGDGHVAQPSLLASDRVPGDLTAVEHGQVRDIFDADFYLGTYIDVREAGLDPFSHYLHHGWREGRNPSARFDGNAYLASYADVRQQDMCPLVHYALVGRKEGRVARPPEQFERKIVSEAEPPSARAKHWLRDIGGPTLSRAALRTKLADFRQSHSAGLMVSISHDDYVVNVGGVQNIVGDELSLLMTAGYACIHVCPAQPLPMLAAAGDASFLVSLRINGEMLGLIAIEDMADMLVEMPVRWPRVYFAVHHLLGFRPEDVTRLKERLAPDGCYMVIHDFFSLCISYTLLRDDVAYCDSPPLSSGSCTICVYGEERGAHLRRIGAFLESTRPTLIIFSPSTYRIWTTKSPFVELEVMQSPLARIDDPKVPVDTPANIGTAERPMRIGFLGTPRHLKGWSVFTRLAGAMTGDSRYEFYKLSARNEAGANIHHLPVSVSVENRLAMVRTLEENDIDVAVIWSLWPETFCFTVHEALAAGCYVLTFRESGNIWPAIEANGGQGACLDDTDELLRLFSSGDIIAHVRGAARSRGSLVVEAPLAGYLLQNESATVA